MTHDDWNTRRMISFAVFDRPHAGFQINNAIVSKLRAQLSRMRIKSDQTCIDRVYNNALTARRIRINSLFLGCQR